MAPPQSKFRIHNVVLLNLHDETQLYTKQLFSFHETWLLGQLICYVKIGDLLSVYSSDPKVMKRNDETATTREQEQLTTRSKEHHSSFPPIPRTGRQSTSEEAVGRRINSSLVQRARVSERSSNSGPIYRKDKTGYSVYC